jgi:hypothetical protein
LPAQERTTSLRMSGTPVGQISHVKAASGSIVHSQAMTITVQ